MIKTEFTKKIPKGLTKDARHIFYGKGSKESAHARILQKFHGGNEHNIRRDQMIRERLKNNK